MRQTGWLQAMLLELPQDTGWERAGVPQLLPAGLLAAAGLTLLLPACHLWEMPRGIVSPATT